MSRIRLCLILLIIILVPARTAYSTPFVVLDPFQPNALGINDLVVGDMVYNVRFISGFFLDIWGDPTSPDFRPPWFWGDRFHALIASLEILGALNSVRAPIGDHTVVPGITAFTESGSPVFANFLDVPYDFISGEFYSFVMSQNFFLDNIYVLRDVHPIFLLENRSVFATFSPVVPEPSSLVLLGTGVGAVALNAWRRRRNRHT